MLEGEFKMNHQKMALMFYNADCITTFKDWKDSDIKVLAKEISELSLRAPIYEFSYEAGFWKRMTKDIKFELLKEENNEFTIKNTNKKYTPLFLMAVLEYCVNRLSGGQVKDKAGFEHLAMAEKLVENKGGDLGVELK